MKNIILLLFVTCTFFSYSQDKEAWLKGTFKDYQALTKCEKVSRKKAKNFLEHKKWDFALPNDAVYKIAKLKLKEEEDVLFIFAGGNLYWIANSDIVIQFDAPPTNPEPIPDPIPRDPKPEPTPTPTPEPTPDPGTGTDPGTDPDEEEPEDDGGTIWVECCGVRKNVVPPADCSEEVEGCDQDPIDVELLFESLEVRQM